MEIYFRDKKLQRLVEDERLLVKTLGKIRSNILLRRLDDMAVANSVTLLKSLPGRFHELTGNRNGQWACDLDHPYRLVFEVEGETTVNIIEIIDYHGK